MEREMVADIKYIMMRRPHKWGPDNTQDTWCLVKVVEPELKVGPFCGTHDVVAVFNLDSDAELFMSHLYLGGAVEITDARADFIKTCGYRSRKSEDSCCDNENRSFEGGCLSCGAPCL
jgi:hypothetical protein